MEKLEHCGVAIIITDGSPTGYKSGTFLICPFGRDVQGWCVISTGKHGDLTNISGDDPLTKEAAIEWAKECAEALKSIT